MLVSVKEDYHTNRMWRENYLGATARYKDRAWENGEGQSVGLREEKQHVSFQPALNTALCSLVAFTNREVGLLNRSPAAQVAV